VEITGDMGSKQVTNLEKIVRQMIVKNLRMEQVEGKHGTIYIAHGLNADGKIVGLWGSRGCAHDFEFNDGVTLDAIRQTLMDHAQGVIVEMVDRDIIDA
jgi:hypothetical protein